MKWIALLLPLLLLMATCGGSSQETTPPSPSPVETIAPATPIETPDSKQERYNEFLETSRMFARKTPLVSCDPAFWDIQIDVLARDRYERVLAELSIIDACHEIGELPAMTEWSEYYAEAPPP